MKIQVFRVDGSIETINLVGTVIASEPGSELEFPHNQSPLHVEATGMDYFFREDGRYDGWGMDVSGAGLEVSTNNNDPMEHVREFIRAIETDREILPKDTQDISAAEAEGIAAELADVATGRVRPLEEIETDLEKEQDAHASASEDESAENERAYEELAARLSREIMLHAVTKHELAKLRESEGAK